VLATARRYPAGVLPEPRDHGAVSARICRLSGLRAGAGCPAGTEWFARGDAPAHTCDWHDAEGGVTLPVEYAEWAERSELPRTPRQARALAPGQVSVILTPGVVRGKEPKPEHGFHIVSPRDGDVYRLSPGVEVRYATVALRAAGGREGASVRWTVDGVPHGPARWTLRPGPHRVRAVTSAGDSAEVTLRVE
jgi:Penicillin-Binding Protein C-terminus Family